MVSGGSTAALKAAQLSATAHHVEHRTLVTTTTPSTPKVSPYLAAASKAWSNSASKGQNDRPSDGKIQPQRVEVHTTNPEQANTIRKSLDNSRSLQNEFVLPMRPSGRSKSQNSDTLVHEVNQFVNAEVIHNGPLQAARISFAHDRELHQQTEMRPPSRPPSAHPLPINNLERQNKSVVSLPWTERHASPPPASVAIRKSVETNRAALSAASLTWASHEHDNPKPQTPKIESYSYITHKPHSTLRKVHKEDSNKFLKHGRVQPMSSSDRKRYDGLWAANKGLLFVTELSQHKDDVANIVVRDIWQRSRLGPDVLASIYDLVDRGARGCLSRDEFVVGTWLVDHSLRGRKLPLQQDLTDDIFDGGYMARLGIKVPKKLKHDEKKWLRLNKKK